MCDGVWEHYLSGSSNCKIAPQRWHSFWAVPLGSGVPFTCDTCSCAVTSVQTPPSHGMALIKLILREGGGFQISVLVISCYVSAPPMHVVLSTLIAPAHLMRAVELHRAEMPPVRLLANIARLPWRPAEGEVPSSQSSRYLAGQYELG